MLGPDSALVRKLTRYLPLGTAELAVIARLEERRRFVAAGTDLVRERQAGHHAYILESGWACSYKLLPDGGRQVIDFRSQATLSAYAASSSPPPITAFRP